MVVANPAPQCMEWGTCRQAMEGELECGDVALITPHKYGLLLAVIDGLGHGAEAAFAANAAAAIMQAFPADPLDELVRRCHEALRKTRGAVLSIAAVDQRSALMTWLGVGNVEGHLFRANPARKPARESLLLRAGVVGYQLPRLVTAVHPIDCGDTLILATDGVDADFSSEAPHARKPREYADSALSRFARKTDDAALLVARYLGGVT